MPESSLLIAVAPNGARRTQADHAAIPVKPIELAQTAAACAEAGAGMIHLHVRDKEQKHSLEPELYRAALKEVEAAVGDRMLVQVTSEAAGIYQADQQMRFMRELEPGCISAGLREFVKDETQLEQGREFFHELHAKGCLIQYILYSPEDVRWYERLCDEGVIPQRQNLVLFVLGRYGAQTYDRELLPAYLAELKSASPWMVCAFGAEEPVVMEQAVKLGGHCRVGFENNLWLPGGEVAPDNAALVKLVADMGHRQGRPLADGVQAARLYRGTIIR